MIEERQNDGLEVPFMGHCVASKPLSVVNTALDWLPSFKIIWRK